MSASYKLHVVSMQVNVITDDFEWLCSCCVACYEFMYVHMYAMCSSIYIGTV